jgi:hypothetical protein
MPIRLNYELKGKPMEAPSDGLHMRCELKIHVTLNVSFSSYRMRDAQLANATAVGQYP